MAWTLQTSWRSGEFHPQDPLRTDRRGRAPLRAQQPPAHCKITLGWLKSYRLWAFGNVFEGAHVGIVLDGEVNRRATLAAINSAAKNHPSCSATAHVASDRLATGWLEFLQSMGKSP